MLLRLPSTQGYPLTSASLALSLQCELHSQLGCVFNTPFLNYGASPVLDGLGESLPALSVCKLGFGF